MNLKQLAFAEAVASTGSFTKASAHCCVTQPTLSNGIAQLEEELGERIFQRSTRNVVLSAFGEHMLPYIKEVLSAERSLTHHASMFLNPKKQLVRIGTTPLINTKILSMIIEPFRLKHQNIDIVLREMNMIDLNRMLDEGLLDFVFGVADLYKGSWTKKILYDEPLLHISRGKTSESTNKITSIKFKDIINDTYVMVPDSCGLSASIRGIFRENKQKLLEYDGEAMSYQVLNEWAALGIGSAILPKSKINFDNNLASFITDKKNRKTTIKFEAKWLDSNITTPQLEEFIEHLDKIAPKIIEGVKLQ